MTATAIGGTSPYAYTWSGGETSPTINNLGAGNYIVTVTDANGCTATCTTALTAPGGPTASCTKIDPTCTATNGGSATVTVSAGMPPYTYAWNGGGTTTTLNNLGAGNYTVTVTDSNLCEVTCNVNLIAPTDCCPEENCGTITVIKN